MLSFLFCVLPFLLFFSFLINVIYTGITPTPGDVCGVSGIDCPKLRCPCYTCPDGINEYGCCSDCVYDDNGNCQNVKKCPTCEDITCDEGKYCIEDDLVGPHC